MLLCVCQSPLTDMPRGHTSLLSRQSELYCCDYYNWWMSNCRIQNSTTSIHYQYIFTVINIKFNIKTKQGHRGLRCVRVANVGSMAEEFPTSTAQKLWGGSFMEWVSITEQLNASLTSTSTMPSAGWTGVKHAITGLCGVMNCEERFLADCIVPTVKCSGGGMVVWAVFQGYSFQ